MHLVIYCLRTDIQTIIQIYFEREVDSLLQLLFTLYHLSAIGFMIFKFHVGEQHVSRA